MNCEPANPTVLVTGATGFLGTAIVRQLSATSCRLRTSGRRTSLVDLPNYSAVNICDQSAVSQLVAGTDVVIHAAGLAHQHHASNSDSSQFFDANLSGTANVVRSAARAGCRRFVYISSVSVYGSGSPPKVEASICLPQSAYAQSKLEGEQIATEVATSVGMELIILRMATLYGENDPGNVGRLLKLIDQGQFIWIGRGENRKSLIHVDDAARACVIAACCRSLPHGNSYNVSAEPCTMHAVVSTLAANLGRREPWLRLPAGLPLMVAAVAARIPGIASRAQRIHSIMEKWLSDEVYDAMQFRRAFVWSPEISLSEGLARQVAWYLGSSSDSSAACDPKNGCLQKSSKRAA